MNSRAVIDKTVVAIIIGVLVIVLVTSIVVKFNLVEVLGRFLPNFGSSYLRENGGTIEGEKINCNLEYAYWNKDTLKIGEEVILVVEGSNCIGSEIEIKIFKSVWYHLRDFQVLLSPNVEFTDDIIFYSWNPQDKGEFYFNVILVGDNKIIKSGKLKVV